MSKESLMMIFKRKLAKRKEKNLMIDFMIWTMISLMMEILKMVTIMN